MERPSGLTLAVQQLTRLGPALSALRRALTPLRSNNRSHNGLLVSFAGSRKSDDFMNARPLPNTTQSVIVAVQVSLTETLGTLDRSTSAAVCLFFILPFWAGTSASFIIGAGK